MKKIFDEFTDLPVSREYKRQLRAKRDGRCIASGCHKPLATAFHCLKHAIQKRECERVRKGCRRRNKSKTYLLARRAQASRRAARAK